LNSALNNSSFSNLDIVAGDIVLGELLGILGALRRYYVLDLNKLSLVHAMRGLADKDVYITNIQLLIPQEFDFREIGDGALDSAFSNSLFSHLSLNPIVLCLRN
jgi:hypothetical protein